jgi:hypothetical protein
VDINIPGKGDDYENQTTLFGGDFGGDCSGGDSASQNVGG